jgi:hypothetical protein
MRLPKPILLSAVALLLGGLDPAAARACTNQALRVAEGGAAATLPDCRAYEQVSPVDKGLTDAIGATGFVQASPAGAAVTYFSLAPFPGVPGAPEFVTYLSSLTAGSWGTQGLLPASVGRAAWAGVRALTGDLAATVIEAHEEPPLAPGANPATLDDYVRDNASGAYSLLAPGPAEAQFAASTGTSSGEEILFEDNFRGELVPGVDDAAGAPYLYEWNGGSLAFVGALPEAEGGGAPPAGTTAGAGSQAYTEGALSEEGARAYFTDLENGRVYVREIPAGKTFAVSPGPATWVAASGDGTVAYYVEGGELFRFELAGQTSESLSRPVSGNAGVLGVLGASRDGAYVYFAATAALPASSAGQGTPVEGQPNVYVWHAGSLRFIATLAPGAEDQADWRNAPVFEPTGPAEGGKGARVTPDGQTLLFASLASLTGYDNLPPGGACGSAPRACRELYLYDVGSGRLRCVSCNPAAPTASADAYLSHSDATLAPSPPRNPFLTRNLSADGRRVFFQTEEGLADGDVNGHADVYEWERSEAEEGGGCSTSSPAYRAASEGCLYLISPGRGEDSYFGDASANGDQVFFFTRQPLVAQDRDENVDLYDARAGGGLRSQNQVLVSEPCLGEAGCRSPSPAPPALGAPATTGLGPVSYVPAPRALTRAELLRRALGACRRKHHGRRRRTCERHARHRYGAARRRPHGR